MVNGWLMVPDHVFGWVLVKGNQEWEPNQGNVMYTTFVSLVLNDRFPGGMGRQQPWEVAANHDLMGSLGLESFR